MKTEWCDRTLFLSPIYFTIVTSRKRLDAELKRLKVTERGEEVQRLGFTATM